MDEETQENEMAGAARRVQKHLAGAKKALGDLASAAYSANQLDLSDEAMRKHAELLSFHADLSEASRPWDKLLFPPDPTGRGGR